MTEIKMVFNGKVEIFQITYACKEYVFCECKTNPAARGFYTEKYVTQNKQ